MDLKSVCVSVVWDLIWNWFGRFREIFCFILDWEWGWKLVEEMKIKVLGKRNLERFFFMEIEDVLGYIEDIEFCIKINKLDMYFLWRFVII